MHLQSTAAYLENREGARARMAPYGRHWRDFSDGLFVVGERLRAPSNYIFLLNIWRDVSDRLFVVEGALQLHFPCKYIRDWRAPNDCKGRLRRPRGGGLSSGWFGGYPRPCINYSVGVGDSRGSLVHTVAKVLQTVL